MRTARRRQVFGLLAIATVLAWTSTEIAFGQAPTPAPGGLPPAVDGPVPGGPPAPGNPPAINPPPPAGNPPPTGNPQPAVPPGDAGPPAGIPPNGNPLNGGVPGDAPPAIGGPGAAPAVGQPAFKDAPDRYYYGAWDYNGQAGYHFTKLFYKAQPADRSYAYHYCICFPSDPTHVYFYDPGKKSYWGRYQYGGKPESCFCALKPEAIPGTDPTAAPPAAIGPPQAFGKVPGAVNATANIIPPAPIPGADGGPGGPSGLPAAIPGPM